MSEQHTDSPQNEQQQVEYRDIPNYPGYLAGSDGSIWSCWQSGRNAHMTDKWTKRPAHHWKKSKYLSIVLFCNQKQKTFTVHSLILFSFVGPRPEGMEACHDNGIPTDNRATNLRWDTPKNNIADQDRHGTRLFAEANPSSKLTSEQVKEIRRLYDEGGFSCPQLGRRYGVNQDTIRKIVKRMTWASV